jgi:uncharacterized protein
MYKEKEISTPKPLKTSYFVSNTPTLMTTTQIILLAIVIYIIICIVAYKVQEYFIFKPEKLSQDFEFQYEDHFEELFFDMEDGARINGLLFYDVGEDTRGLVIYFHGNTRSIKGWSKYAKDFIAHDYDVLMIDYRGFGKSTGKRTEDVMYKDAEIVYNQMLKRYNEKNIVIYGRSLGSGFACKLASKNNPKMLILDAPYYSFSQLTSRFLPILPVSFILRFSIRTDEAIKYVKCPIYIIHGTKDLLIPFRSSVKLRKLAPQNARLVPIYGGGHNNLPSFAEYHKHLEDILLDRFDLIFDKHVRVE